MARNSQLTQDQEPDTQVEQPVRTGEPDGAPERGRVSQEPAPGQRPTRDRDLSRRERAGNYFREHPRARLVVFVVAAVLIAAGIYLWIQHITWESTDDAQVQGHIMPLSSRIGGNIQQVNVQEGQRVKAGDVLVTIDPTDYQVALARAQADLQDAEAQGRAAGTNVPITAITTSTQVSAAQADVDNAQAGIDAAQKQVDAAQAKLSEAQATAAKNNADLNRYKQLVDKQEISRQQYDQAVAAAQVGQAGVESARANLAAAQQQVIQARSRLQQAQAALANARTAPQQLSVTQARAASANAAVAKQQAAVKQAELNLSYAVIKSPVDGIVGRKSVEVGQNVQPGQELLTVVPLNDVWVIANFKETQLKNMRPGQPVKVSVDAYGRDYKGHVEAIGGATGAMYSLLPPENATGNYVKVVQRVPVRIVLEQGENQEELLRPGMSVVPKVNVRHR
jgi:membrane fusion protein, multidrug efflux system